MTTTDRVMLITGASRGIGAATAVVAALKGWDLVLTYRDRAAEAAAVVSICESAGRRALAVQADVASEPDVLTVFDTVDAQFGRLDSLVNNAGVLGLKARLEDFTVQRIQQTLAVNVTGSFLCAREAVKRMSTAHGGIGGSIVNVSSAASRLGSANEFVDYAASKGAIDSMTIGLANEVARDGIRVNAVRPGLIQTEIHANSGQPDRVERLAVNVPMGRGGTAKEVAEAILWLASDESSYVTGTFVDVTGGR